MIENTAAYTASLQDERRNVKKVGFYTVEITIASKHGTR